MAPTAIDRRPSLKLECDLLVVGGGASGVAAATEAARSGLDVVLLERYGFCGGGAVAGLSGTICGMYAATDRPDAQPQQVVHGFVDEFVTRMEAIGGLAPPVRYGKTFTRVHEPFAWRRVADGLLGDAGVRVIYHATATSALVEGGEAVEGVLAYTKQGLASIRAKLTIDASGDADIVAMAGLPSFVGREGRVQNPTMIFRLMNVDVERFVARYGSDTIMPPEITALIAANNAAGTYDLPRSKIWLFPSTRPHELLCNCTRIIGADGRELNTLIADDFSEAEINGRRQAVAYARFFRDHLEGCEQSFINDTGVAVGVRQTRQAKGMYTLSNSDVVVGRKFPDGIARSPWPIELHSGSRPKVEWLLDDIYEVPFGCFVPEFGESLLVAGRCLSAEHEAVASARVTAQCFSYGQATGLAAVLAIENGCPVRSVPGQEVRLRLNRAGARLDAQ